MANSIKDSLEGRKRKALYRSHFDWGQANKVCEQLSLGNSLTKICKMPGMPTYRCIHIWIQNSEEFAEKFRMARDLYYQHMADEMMDIVDNENEAGVSQAGEKEDVWHRRLRAETRQWVLARVLPKMYGTRPIDPGTAGKITEDLLAIIRNVTDIAAGRTGHDVIEAEIVPEGAPALTDAIKDEPWRKFKEKKPED